MSRSIRGTLLRYSLAVLIVAGAIILIAIPAVGKVPNNPAIILFLAILLAAWQGGLGPGLLATALFALMTVSEPFTAWRAARHTLFVSTGGMISFLVGSLHSARRRAEAATRKAREHEDSLRLLIDSVQDCALFGADVRGRVTSWNVGAERVLGYEEEEALGMDIARFFTEDDAIGGMPRSILDSVISEGRIADERWQVRKDGTRFWASSVVVPLHPGEDRGFTVVFRDETERKRAADERSILLAGERSARREAEAANRAKDQFLAVLSHELRTPLTPVLATATAALDEPGTSEEVRHSMELIRRCVELETRLIDDLLDVSRVAHGKIHLDRSAVEFHQIVHQTLAICRGDLDGKRIRLELGLDARRHRVEADPARLQQVLWNLIKNAVKFTPSGGRIAIRTRNEATSGAGGRLVLEVADSGVGIEPDVMPLIFEAFEQGEITLVRRFGGLGLGLAISRSVVEAHGGRLRAASAGRDLGATFTLELETVEAIVPGPEGAAEPPASRTSSEQGLRILLVEDDDSTLRVMSRLLQKRRHAVTTAESLSSALEVGMRGDFDLVISDIGLPDGTGWDLMRRLRERGEVRGIAMTGFGTDEDELRSKEAGFLAHLTKPVSFHHLEAAITRVTSLT